MKLNSALIVYAVAVMIVMASHPGKPWAGSIPSGGSTGTDNGG